MKPVTRKCLAGLIGPAVAAPFVAIAFVVAANVIGVVTTGHEGWWLIALALAAVVVSAINNPRSWHMPLATGERASHETVLIRRL